MTDEQTATDEQTEQTDEQQGAKGWRPERGDRIVGTVIDVAATDMGYGVYPIVTLKTASGEVAVHAFHTVLRRELARRRPTVGDDLDITYLGKQKGGMSDRGYDGYRVRSSKDVQGYNWDRDLPDGERTAELEQDVPIEPAAPATTPAAEDDNESVPF